MTLKNNHELIIMFNSTSTPRAELKEAVDAVVNSFAKHTQAFGRGYILIKF